MTSYSKREEGERGLPRHREIDTKVIDELADQIAETAAHIDAASHRLLTQIREFDSLDGWYSQGAISSAQWLAWRIGLDPGAAREKLRCARALGDLPLIDRAFSQAKLSYSKIRALTRVANADNEEMLLNIAYCSTAAQLEKICRLYRSVDRDAPESEPPPRFVSVKDHDSGMVRITAQLRPEQAALVMKAIDTAAARVCAEACRADGLVALAEGPAVDRAPHFEVAVRVDASTLAGEDDEPALLGEDLVVSAESARRITCDASVYAVVEDAGGTPLSVGRKRRTLPTALKRALAHRDPGCRFPGCHHQRWLDAHHVTHWARGGPTELANLVTLCKSHHVLVHEGSARIERRADGALAFIDARGRPIANAPRPAAGSIQKLRAKYPNVGADAHVCSWNGEPPDYRYVVDSMRTWSASPSAGSS